MLGLVSYFRRDVVRGGRRIGLGDPVVAARRVIALPTDAEQRQRLLEISRSRTEPTSRVERARIIRQVAMLRGQAGSGESQGQDSGGGGSLAVVSYDEKPGIQAIGTTAPDRPPLADTSPTVMRDHEYKRHGTLTLMAGIDLLTG